MRLSFKLLLLIGARNRGAVPADHDAALDTGSVSLSLDFAADRYGVQSVEEAFVRASGASLGLDFITQQFAV